MKRSSLLLVGFALLLAGCSDSHRPVYSGHEESTAEVPGFVNGKRVSPHVKLGQSYTVDGETYVPRNQPDYVEEGMASWYGPGFHGGKTANGEQFDTGELTAAHRTLPLPSIVRVTLVSTGKQVYVRVNDRGPFAHSRIIDLSRAAADKIGLLQAGVGKVRVEYMKAESVRFAELLAKGRDPKSIDLASEVLNYNAGSKPVDVARADTRIEEPVAAAQKPAQYAAAPKESSKWSKFSPISDAAAAEPVVVEGASAPSDAEPAPVSNVSSADLPGSKAPSTQAEAPPLKGDGNSPFAAMDEPQPAVPPKDQVASIDPPPEHAPPGQPAAPPSDAYYVQLGAFLKLENATKVQNQFAKVGTVEVVQKPNAKGQMLYHARMGPLSSQQDGNALLAKVKEAGGEDARVVHE